MRCLYRERRWECGDYLEIDIFPVFRVPTSRSKRARPSTETQERLNRRNAQRQLIRLLNANFTEDDYEIHLTYREDRLPEDDNGAAREVRNFLRRVKNANRKKTQDEIKYVYVTEGGGKKRYHHHVTISCALTRDELEALWWNGYANTRRLQFSEDGIEGLAKYITKQIAGGEDHIPTRRSWNASKNLVRPQPKDRDGKISAVKVREMAQQGTDSSRDFVMMNPGWCFASKEIVLNPVNGETYIFARMYRERRRGGGKDDKQGDRERLQTGEEKAEAGDDPRRS